MLGHWAPHAVRPLIISNRFRVDGNALRSFCHGEVFSNIVGTKVASSPGRALAKIREMYGKEPAANGNDNPGIVLIRNCFAAAVAPENDQLNAFLITAPHTHWDRDKPVIISRSEHGYVVGPQPIDVSKYYTPVSFVFEADGPVPYEWADDSIRFQPNDLNRTAAILNNVGMQEGVAELPFGLSLRFWFKNLFAPPSEATIEYTEDESVSELAQVYELKAFQKTRTERDYAQVGWHPYAPAVGLKTGAKTELFEIIIQLSEQLSDQEKSQLAHQIETLQGDDERG